MSRSRNAFACTLLLSILWAAPAREALSAAPLNLFARLWETVESIWAPAAPQESAPAPTTDEGCGIDPHGGCKSGS
jgi:hypothetical protein